MVLSYVCHYCHFTTSPPTHAHTRSYTHTHTRARARAQSLWRKADIIADATMGIIAQPATFSGNMLIDDTFLKGGGFTQDDLVQYRCDPECEPPRMLDFGSNEAVPKAGAASDRSLFKRGDVRKLDSDIGKSQDLPSKL